MEIFWPSTHSTDFLLLPPWVFIWAFNVPARLASGFLIIKSIHEHRENAGSLGHYCTHFHQVYLKKNASGPYSSIIGTSFFKKKPPEHKIMQIPLQT